MADTAERRDDYPADPYRTRRDARIAGLPGDATEANTAEALDLVRREDLQAEAQVHATLAQAWATRALAAVVGAPDREAF